MDGVFKVAAILGVGGFGLGALGGGDLSAVDLSSLNLEMLEGAASDMKEVVRYVREEGEGDLAKLLQAFEKMQK